MRVKAITFCIGLAFIVLDVKPILVRAQSLPKVLIGYPASSIASIQLFIAQEKGFFRDEGIRIEFVESPRSTQSLPLIERGDIDVLGA